MRMVCWSLLVLTLAAVARPTTAFIQASPKGFTDSECGADFSFTGFDTWRLIEAAAGVPGAGTSDPAVLKGESYLDYVFGTASRAGLTFTRFFATADLDGGLPGKPLQSSPGKYNEDLFVGMDKVLVALAKYNIKASVVLIDFWKRTDGVQQYLEWCAGGSDDVATFYSSPQCRQLYLDHVTAVLNRKNSITGVAYKDDPSIFGWEIINEPRCALADSGRNAPPESCVQGIQDFIDAAAAHIKSIDKNHLVTVGEEGFFGTNGPYSNYNPQSTQSSGQSFEDNHAGKNIDYTSIHVWPDNWDSNILSKDFVTTWIEQHERASKALNKPLVVSEFGIQCLNGNSSCVTGTRDPYYQTVYQATQASQSSGGVLRGSAFWVLAAYSEGDTNKVNPYDVSFTSSTFTGPVTKAAASTKANGCPPAGVSNVETAG